MLRQFIITQFCNEMAFAKNTADNFTMVIDGVTISEEIRQKMVFKRDKALADVEDLQEEINALRTADDDMVYKLCESIME